MVIAKLCRRLLAACVLACLVAVALLAQDYKALLGKWSMSSETDGESINWTLELREADGHLAGFLSANGQEAAAKNFSYAGGVIKFIVPYESEEYQIELRADGENKLTGTWNGSGSSGRTSGTKR